MTATRHPTPAERLLALLADEAALETLPAEEIRADLSAVGVDPVSCIAFARALSGGTDSPGGRLLGAIARAEDADDEVARLESANIESVRGRVPGGSAAAVAGAARRQAGSDDRVVGLRRRRRSRILRWGGPAAGIAASVLLVVVSIRLLDTEFPEILGATDHFSGGEADGGAPVEFGDDVVAEKTAPEPSVTAPQPEASGEHAPRNDEAAEGFARNAVPEAERPERGAGADTEGRIGRLAKQAPDEREAPAPPAGTGGILRDEKATADRVREPSASQESPVARGLAAKPAPGAAEPDSTGIVAAMVIEDPSQVPSAVQSQVRFEPGLAARLDEAHRLAGDRPVVALYRISGPAGRQDFAQVPLEAPTQQMPAPPPLIRLLGPAAADYDFLALPAE